MWTYMPSFLHLPHAPFQPSGSLQSTKLSSLCMQQLPTIRFVHGSVCMSLLLFQFVPPSPSCPVSTSPFSTSVRTAIWPSNSTTGHISWENSNSKRLMYPKVHCNTIYNRPRKQCRCPSTHDLIKKDVVPICNGMLLSHYYILIIKCDHWYMCSVTQLCLFVTPWTIEHQTPLSMEFSRQEYWSGLPFLPPGDLPSPGIESTSPALAGAFFNTEPSGKPIISI